MTMPRPRHARRFRLLPAFLVMACFLPAGPAVAQAPNDAPDEVAAPDTLSRLFLLRLDVPDLPLEVRSESGGAWSGRTDAGGLALFRLAVADDDVLALRSTDPGWTLAVETPIRNAHLDPGVALELDLSADLEPATEKEAESAVSEPTAPEPIEPEPPQPKAAPADPCTDPTGLECRLHRLRDLEAARRAGDCRRALAVAEEMGRETPDFVASDAVAPTLAEIHLECSLEASRASRTAVDPADARRYGERAELLARRGLEIARGADGRGWCDAERSRVLAAAHDALRQPAAAAAGARRARDLCPDATPPAEWETLFRIRLGQWDRARDAADSLAGNEADDARDDLGTFLRAWVQHRSAGCDALPALDLAHLAGADLPCRGLPRWICRRARIALVLDCGDDAAHARLAEALRSELDAGPGAAEPEEEIREDLAEVQYLRGELDEAAELFARLEANDPPGRERGVHACRLGSTLLRAGRASEALAAFRRAAGDLLPGTLDHAVAVNNAVVLAAEEEKEEEEEDVSGEAVDRLAAAIAGLQDARLGIVPWRLVFENNLLHLRTRAEAGAADARAGLRRLERLDPELRRHLGSVRALSTTEQSLALAACSIPVFARDDEDRETGAQVDPGG